MVDGLIGVLVVDIALAIPVGAELIVQKKTNVQNMVIGTTVRMVRVLVHAMVVGQE